MNVTPLYTKHPAYLETMKRLVRLDERGHIIPSEAACAAMTKATTEADAARQWRLAQAQTLIDAHAQALKAYETAVARKPTKRGKR